MMGSESIFDAIMRLRCAVLNYDWGIKGDRSTVAKLYNKNSKREIENEKPYAEFWMGTHESGPSSVVLDEEEEEEEEIKLKSWIGANPPVLGEKVVERWGNYLPFLFKVLSVAKALSIQAHLDKELAKVLNKMHPNLYQDPNHKPEMAIAITEFVALCGFVSTKDLKNVLSNVPEIKDLVSLEDENLIMNIIEKDGQEK